MLDLIGTLVDKLIQLVKQRQETNRKLHDDFLAPILADFEKLHQDYLTSFRAYRLAIESERGAFDSTHPLIAKIEQDSLYSDHLRAKLEPLREYRGDPLFGDVLRSFAGYISGGESGRLAIVHGASPLSNAPRSTAITGLKEVFARETDHSTKRREALAVLDRVVADLQDGYRWFNRNVATLKKGLLDPRI
jgi:hypothetical protein